jgi:hypothetical protein
MSLLPPSQSASSRAARRILGRENGLRGRIEQLFVARRARRGLVVAWSAVLVAAAVLPLAVRLQDALGPALVIDGLGLKLVADPLPLFAVAAALGWIVRTAVRRVADLPDEDIDERQIALRDRTYLIAYRIVGATVLWLMLAAFIVADASATRAISASVAAWLMDDLFFVLVTLIIFLPSAVLAWYVPDEVDDGS